ncbi:MAG: hypothetical protein A2202_03690 [Bdellovibrionales bacterium RIFOXYA1_FULL_36_14]|nr:MAG: hypothetical protein A2202_03690 [Bdellovibrionales bacterium RIFOXYA1_FULL_36_14]
MQIKQMDFSKVNESTWLLSVAFQGMIEKSPKLSFKDSIIQVELSDAIVWPKIEKKVSLSNGDLDTTLLAYQYDKKVVRVRAILPFSTVQSSDNVKMQLVGDRINIEFQSVTPATEITASTKKNSDQYDESYLEQLLKDKKGEDNKKNAAVAMKNDFSNILVDKTAKPNQDQVKVRVSSAAKKENWKSNFSIQTFVAKVVAFFACILLVFYGLATLMRKGVFKKTRLGFLSNEKMVEVLSTTYIAPKRSVIMIKAYDQVFLVGNSEKGMHFLSEINHVPGLLKTGERSMTGTNFDTNLQDAAINNLPQQIKENIEISKEETSTLAGFLKSTKKSDDSDKLSNKIKSKVKNLKSLQ